MPDKKKKTPAQQIKANKKIAHTKKLPNIGYGMTSAPLDPAQKAKNRKTATTAGVALLGAVSGPSVGASVGVKSAKLSNFGSYDPFKAISTKKGKK